MPVITSMNVVEWQTVYLTIPRAIQAFVFHILVFQSVKKAGIECLTLLEYTRVIIA